MLFHEKVTLLLKELGVTNAALSRASELDVSLISRFRSGERIPSRFSSQLDKLAMGAATLAVQYGMAARLCDICGVPAREEVKALYDVLAAWINDEDSGLRPQRARSAGPIVPQREGPPAAFAETLDTLMGAARVSNAQLAAVLHVDASLISRYRTGMRRPDTNGRMLSNICTYFSTLSLAPQCRAALGQAAGVSTAADAETLYNALYALLHPKYEPDERELLDTILAQLDEQQRAFPAYAQAPPPPDAEQPPPGAYYIGAGGFRGAMLRLLRTAIDDPAVKDLALYSDQPLGILLGDEAFSRTVVRYMMQLFERGVRLRIIHDISRPASELMRMFETCLPFYMTGRVKTYFCKRPRDARFSFTIFIAGRSAAFTSSGVAAALPFAQYVYTDNAQLVANMRTQFATLLRTSARLVRAFLPHQAEAYFEHLSQFERDSGDADVLHGSLSLYTMPQELFERILRRADMCEQIRQSLLAYHALSAQRARKNLALYHVADYIVLPTEEQLHKGLVPVPFTGFCENKTELYYTREEYAEHLHAMQRLMRQNPRYEIHLLPEKPFSGVNIALRQGVGVHIRKTICPQAAFFLEHASLFSFFTRFFDQLRLRSTRLGAQSSAQLPAYLRL